jgi:adenine-specific DNA-methyltransferase
VEHRQLPHGRDELPQRQKQGRETLIAGIKSEFRSEISLNDLKVKKLKRLSGELFQLTNQQQLFEMSKKEKADWNTKVENLSKETRKLEAEIEEIKANRIFENAFEWRFEFPEVLNDEGDFVGFDVVIGNPPYIRQEEFTDIKNYLQSQFTIFSGTADMYVYFVELSMRLLRKKGNFTFIIPNKWMRAGYGKNLRSFVQKHRIEQIIDFGDLPVFDEATTYPSIIQMKKASPLEQFNAININTLDFPSGLAEYIDKNKMVILAQDLQPEGWTLSSSKVQKLLSKIKSKGVPLSEFVNGKIYRGVLTGLNEAFVIDKATYDRLIAEDPNSSEIIKPFFAGRDIKRYQQPLNDKYLIFARRGIDIEKYQAVLRHLEKYKTQLEPKPKNHSGDWLGRKPGAYKWYEIQDAVDYYEEFEKEKIVYPNICKQPEFTIVEKGYYTNQKCFIITHFTTSLLAFLNSKLCFFLFKSILPKLRGDFYEPSYIYFKDFPIVPISSDHLENITQLILAAKKLNPSADTTDLEHQIDQLVYQLYDLTEEEIKIVEGTN